jgi:anhydro-N-acetylmuramic acid kinase
MTPNNQTRLVAGCMTGTSIDSLDAALLEISGRGLDMRIRWAGAVTRELGGLRPRLRALADQHPVTAAEVASLAHDFALLHASALQELCAAEGRTPDLVCVHGQTVYHKPPLSWQLMQPAPIARALRCPVVYDLRAADLAAGGQGAPITPLADYILYASPDEPRDIVNLGGFCNITHLPTRASAAGLAAIRGQDVCACNQVLDAVSRATTGKPYDDLGVLAMTGEPDPRALGELMTLLERQSRSGRSLGTGDELAAWIEAERSRHTPEDIAATAAQAVGRTIARHLPHATLLAGGGARNSGLVMAIKARAAGHIIENGAPGDGAPADYREAACFAILGALCQDRVPITLPQVTHVQAPAPLSGHWVLP